MVAIFSRFTHSVRCRFFNIVSMSDPVRDTCWPSDYGCGGADTSKFTRFVEGCKPEVNEVWILVEGSVTPKVHPTARVEVNTKVVCKFATNYLTENGFKTSIF